MEIIDPALEKIILDIESSDFQNIDKKSVNETFELWHDPVLLQDLSGNFGVLFVRAILNKLNVNEHHVFRWRLENKYIQSQVLNHYVPGCVAETIGLSQILNTENGEQKIRELCANGFFIKATLGHRTGQANSYDRTEELDNIIHSYQTEYDGEEKWMLQKRLALKEEFRIHSFSRDIIYGLTFIMTGLDPSKNVGAGDFLKGILEKLPDTILQGTLIGWDIGITDTGEYYVIEANFTGFHPEFARGFQTSGYFGDDEYGPILCAWLNNYFRIKYHVSIGSVESRLLESNPFYTKFMYYVSLFNNGTIKFHRKDAAISLIIYLGEVVNRRLVTLLWCFMQGIFADKYYLIINKKNYLTISNPFSEFENVNLLIEDTLFTEDQYPLIEQLSDESRKKICSAQALQVINAESYFML